jgi:hypothetical protein
MKIFTVATVSYLYQVEVLFASLRKIHPECRLALILADCSDQLRKEVCGILDGRVDVLTCEDLEIDDLKFMRLYYSALEFCSAIKVLGLRHFLKDEEVCMFLDPDIVVFNRLDEAVFNLKGEIAISVHSHSPFPEDGDSPNDLEPCLAGHINGGILLARKAPHGMQILDWLASKTRCQWFVAPKLGMYADQQWLSALPYFFRESTSVILDKGVNVAYWNLHERLLRKNESGRILVNEETSLKCFHFSGFPPSNKSGLTIHSTRKFSEQTQLTVGELIKKYKIELDATRKKYAGLRGDLQFSKLSLHARIRKAEKYWGPHPSLITSIGINDVIKRIINKIKISIGGER